MRIRSARRRTAARDADGNKFWKSVQGECLRLLVPQLVEPGAVHKAATPTGARDVPVTAQAWGKKEKRPGDWGAWPKEKGFYLNGINTEGPRRVNRTSFLGRVSFLH